MHTDRPVLCVRADGGEGIGDGHLARGFALAEAWARHGTVRLVSAEVSAPWLGRFQSLGVEVLAPHERAYEGAAWVSLDGYDLHPDELVRATASDARVLAIADHGTGPLEGDLLLDQNLGAAASAYPGESGSRLLLGARYALLRSEFEDAQLDRLPPPAQAREGLLLLGGSPAEPVRALFHEARDLCGSRGLALRAAVGEQHLAQLMAKTPIAVSAAGSTSLELASLGVPMVLVAVAPNQLPVAERFGEAGAAVNLGWWEGVSGSQIAVAAESLALDVQARAAMSEIGRELVDGLGAVRVVTRLRSHLVDLRPVVRTDAEMLFNWANDATVRAMARDPSTITWDEHLRWLEGQLTGEAIAFLVGLVRNRPVGQVRFTRSTGRSAEIHISIEPSARGNGLGPALIETATRHVFGLAEVDEVHARIRADNKASRRAFVAANFDLRPPDHLETSPWVHYARSRS